VTLPRPTPDDIQLFRTMLIIRRFEETVLEQFQRGVFFGTTHTYLGQEANAAGVLHNLSEEDIVFSNHRCHGHFLAYGGDPRRLFAELMGKASGVCGGRGGSQHLQWCNFYSNGVQGGIVPVATGMALAEKYKGTRALTVVFLGDGTLGEGVIYEAFNLAALRQAPILFVLENNHIAQTTPTSLALAGTIAARFEAFGIPAVDLDTSDVLEILPAARNLFDRVRRGEGPQALILNTYRFGPHSKGDDTRPAEEIASFWKEHDPIKIMSRRLEHELISTCEAEIETLISTAFHQALDDPLAEPASLVYSL
jgi:acetoin:2,6-dichlorophenolindophenol oxidoreductase subunit alpha